MSSRIDGAGDGGIPHIEKPSQVVEPVTPPAEIPEKFPPHEEQGGISTPEFEGEKPPKKRYFDPETYNALGKKGVWIELTDKEAVEAGFDPNKGQDIFETIA